MIDLEYESVADSAASARAVERRALRHSITLLQKAGGEPDIPANRVEASFFARMLWAAFIGDLGSPQNGLSDELRAQLISIGLRMLDCAERLREGDLSATGEMIEVSEIIAAGLVE